MTARLLELFPGGHEVVERHDVIELAVYVGEGELDRLGDAFPGVRAVPVGEGWADEWKRFHRPVTIGQLWIGPPWEESPDELIRVAIDPGRAFGTGAHPTTRLCLELLLELERGALLDVGCGSGILAIVGAKVGYGPVVAVDSDPAAVEAATRNAAANAAELEVRRANATTDSLPATDVAVGNIDRATVVAVAPRLRCRRLVTTGYFESEDARLEGFRHLERRRAERWAADLYERE